MVSKINEDFLFDRIKILIWLLFNLFILYSGKYIIELYFFYGKDNKIYWFGNNFGD
jgi:hypothetical protein